MDDVIEILKMLLRGDVCEDPKRIRKAVMSAKIAGKAFSNLQDSIIRDCRRGFQRCHECWDIGCCDNDNESAQEALR